MSITVATCGFIAECPLCKAGRVCTSEILARAWVLAHICRGTK